MRTPWLGAAQPLAAGAITASAADIGCTSPALRAVIRVEASGRWFERDGTLPRRFEPHKLPAAIQAEIKWSGGWQAAAKLSGAARDALFRLVYARHPAAALTASSWGGPQMMGFHADALGYASAEAMVEAFADDAQAQLDGLVSFLRASGLLGALRAQDWRTFARGYNGSGQVDVYAARLASAYAREAGAPSAVVLRIGDQGAGVVELQRALGIEPDGKFGPATLRSVEAFQCGEGLPVDGLVGDRTWTALRAGANRPTPTPPAQAGTFDVRVAQAQKIAGVVGAAGAAVGGLTDRLGETAQAILAGGVALAVVALAVSFGIGRARAGRTA